MVALKLQKCNDAPAKKKINLPAMRLPDNWAQILQIRFFIFISYQFVGGRFSGLEYKVCGYVKFGSTIANPHRIAHGM